MLRRLSRIPRTRYLATLGGLLAAVIAWSAVHPSYPKDWLVENILVVLIVPLLVFTYRRFPLSRLSYTLIFVFLCLHELGAHWTYANVPYDDWFESIFGVTLTEIAGHQRNHFDRLVHFAYGLLLAYPIREVFLRIAEARGFWGYFLPLNVIMSTSMLYELLEWAAAAVFGGELGEAYLGTQGDVWDAHQDMAWASFGALLAMVVTAIVVARTKRDFTREFIESLRVKSPAPLGEDALARPRRGHT